MKVIAKIISVGEVKSGTSARTGNNWQNVNFVIEAIGTEDRYVLRTFSKSAIDKLAIGLVQEFDFSGAAEEYKCIWYNHLNLNRMSQVNLGYSAPAEPAKAEPMPSNNPTEQTNENAVCAGKKTKAVDAGTEGEKSDLPF